MGPRLGILIIGVVYLILGILGFVPGLYATPPAGVPPLHVTAGYGFLFGIFPVNITGDIFRIVVGVLGILFAATFRTAESYSRLIALVFAILTFCGFVPHIDTLLGAMPIYSNDAWLHMATAVIAAYFGWVASAETNLAPATSLVHPHA
ncbi:MAG: DUF4383 domain-containing protein [Chloroflexota bacterium]